MCIHAELMKSYRCLQVAMETEIFWSTVELDQRSGRPSKPLTYILDGLDSRAGWSRALDSSDKTRDKTAPSTSSLNVEGRSTQKRKDEEKKNNPWP